MTTDAPQFKAIIFDLDGTLLNTLPDLVEVTNTALQRAGMPVRTQQEILGFVGNGVQTLISQAVPEGTSPEQLEQVYNDWCRIHHEIGTRLTHPFPHVVEALDQLTTDGIALGVLSNKFDTGVQEVVAQYLPGYFAAVHGESADIPRKPNPKGLQHTIAELGLEPHRCMYVGDSPNDIRTAKAAGAFGVAVAWGYHPVEDFSPEDVRPHLIVNDPRELAWLVEGK